MKKRLSIFCVALCLVFQFAGVPTVEAAEAGSVETANSAINPDEDRESSATKDNVFWEGYIYYHIVGKNKVEPLVMDIDYAKQMGYYDPDMYMNFDDGDYYPDEKITFEYPSAVIHDGVTYKVTRLPDYTGGGYYEKGDLRIVANAWDEGATCLSDDIPSVTDVIELNRLNAVTKIVLPDTLQYLGNYSLQYGHILEEVVFAESYQNLVFGHHVFSGYPSISGYPSAHLKSIVVPDGTTQLGDAALGYIPDITIPASVRIIGSYVVNPYTQKVTIDSQNRKFKMKDGMLYSKNEKVLYGASAKVKASIKISAKTEEIKPEAFAYSKVKEVKLSSKVNRLPKGVFAYCGKLTKVTGTKHVTNIGYGAFGYCKKLKSIGKMPKLKYINKGAFWGCKKLKFKPGKNVKIAKHAFTVKGK